MVNKTRQIHKNSAQIHSPLYRLGTSNTSGSGELTSLWIKSIRADGRVEFLCRHGVGHGNHIHGCDGCCFKKSYPLRYKSKKKIEQTNH